MRKTAVPVAFGGVRLKPLFGLHALRRGAASLFIDQGLTPKQLNERMGHSTIKLTYDLYGHLFADPEGDQATARAIEARVLG